MDNCEPESKSVKPKNGIIADVLKLEDYKKLNYACACEDCSHFDKFSETCTFGYPTGAHLRRSQIAQLETLGTIAFCRALEID